MTDAIQRNAANILAISLLLFTNAVTAPVNKPLLRISRPAKKAPPIEPNNLDIAPNLVAA
jgi:hypothetical protein